MFWWRKRNEGFEWRDYVRTTILVRREQRRQKLKDVQAAAAAQIKDVGHRGLDAGISGVREAGVGLSSVLGRAARGLGTLILKAGAAIAEGAVSLATAGAALGRRAGTPMMPILEPLLSFARSPNPNLALKIVAILAAFGAAYRSWSFGFDSDARVAALVAILAGGLVVLALLSNPFRVPSPRRTSSRSRAGESLLTRLGAGTATRLRAPDLSARTVGIATLSLIALTAAGLTTFYVAGLNFSTQSASTRSASAPGNSEATDPSKLEGRAVAVGGDTLRIGSTPVILEGIEAPDVGQSCVRSSGKWPCGQAAKDALANLVRGRRVTCDLVGEADNGAKQARCATGGEDLGGKLIRNGNVFSNGGFLSRYAGLENEAQDAKVGIWSGEAERPQDYRSKRWEEARRAAPDGCPIKGRIRSGARTYVLPWSPTYDSIKLSVARGERWFCSESEAQAAGWTAGSRS